MRILVLPLLAALVLAPTAMAQFGTQTKVGDADATPALAAASIPVNVNENDFGVTSQLSDNCMILDMGTTAAAGAQALDIHLNGCVDDGTTPQHFSPFQFVLADPIDIGSPYPQVNGGTAEIVMYGDANANGAYDGNDTIFVKSATGATGFTPGTSTGSWVLRLTPYQGQPAGSIVFSNHADNLAYGASAKQMTSVSIGYVERDNVTGGQVDTGITRHLSFEVQPYSVVLKSKFRLNLKMETSFLNWRVRRIFKK